MKPSQDTSPGTLRRETREASADASDARTESISSGEPADGGDGTKPPPSSESEAALLQVAQYAYQAEQERHDWAEEKAERYLTVLAFVLAITTIGLPDAVKVLFDPHGPLETSFLAAAAISFLATVVSVGLALWVMRVGTVGFLPVDGSLESKFRGGSAVEALAEMSDAFLREAKTLRAKNDKRFEVVEAAYFGLLTVVICAVLALGLFFLIKVQESTMAKTTTTTSQTSQPSTQPASGTATPGGSTQRPIQFVPVTRETPQTTEKR